MREPPWWLYVMAGVIGPAAAYAVGLIWLAPFHAAIAAAMALLPALWGVFMMQNGCEAIVLCTLLAFIVGTLLAVTPERFWLPLAAIPVSLGFGVGVILVGVWREVARV